MVVNSCITVFHKTIDEQTRLETWQRFNYGTKDNYTVWSHGAKIAKINKGFTDNDNIKIRVPYELNENLDINNFSLEDIIIIDEITSDIESQQDLIGYDILKITSLTNDNFGNNPHIYIGVQ